MTTHKDVSDKCHKNIITHRHIWHLNKWTKSEKMNGINLMIFPNKTFIH